MENAAHRLILTKRVLGLATALVILGAAGFVDAAEEHPAQHPEQVFDAMRKAFVPEKASGLRVSYQWHLQNPDGGEWFVVVNDGRLQMGRGTVPNPDVVFICTGRDWVALSNGTLNGFWAHLTGRLKIRGPQQLARKLDEMFP